MEGRNCAGRSPLRATYVNLYPPESDVEFVRSVATAARRRHRNRPQPHEHVKVVDSYSCRQMFLKSYTFTKKESAHEKAKNWVTKAKEKIAGEIIDRMVSGGRGDARAGGKCLKLASCTALFSTLRRLLSCTSDVDVAERRP